jgi:hypothetical protein
MTILSFHWFLSLQLQLSFKIVQIGTGCIHQTRSFKILKLMRVRSYGFGECILLFEVVLPIEGGGLHIAKRIFLRGVKQQQISGDYFSVPDLYEIAGAQLVPL